MNKNVLIIYTGGTIGMKKTEKGYAPVSGFLGEAISAIPDMNSPSAPKWDLYEMSPLLDSSDITVKEWNTDSSKKSRWLDHLTVYDSEGRKIEEEDHANSLLENQ